MRLKCLELHGFKSFADKTKIDFHAGVTGIVGPNGCGKSNVVDAVRWALGETSAKALRGGEMADVIFNGTDRRKPLGMAEVSLTFSDCEADLGVEFNEVRVTRRVYRDGKGEYELNGNTCRLKDINKLFMDTGVGRSAYSIMEQGKIDMLLSAKPEDRRAVFEEAAGITKSKAEKREALRKVEYTDANLLRVTDVLAEMKRQMGATQRQAAKAQRWKDLHNDVRVMDTHLHFQRHHELAGEHAALEASVTRLREMQTEREERIHDDEVQLAADRAELQELDLQLGNLRHQLNERQNALRAAESRMEFNRERKREMEALIARNTEDLAAGGERLREMEAELKSADETLAAIRENMERQREEIEEHGRVTAAAREEKARLERELREVLQGMHQAEGRIVAARAEMTACLGQIEADEAWRAQLQSDADALEAADRAAREEEETVTAELERERERIEAGEETARRLKDEALEAERELEELTARHGETARLYNEKAGRAEALRGLLEQGAGLEQGTRAVLNGLDDPEISRDGVRGVLSGLIEVDRQFIPAVEAALGANLHAVPVADGALAETILNALKARKLGEAVLLPEDLMPAEAESASPALPSGALAWARDKVRAPEAARPLVDRLLKNTAIAPDLAAALRLKREHPGLAFATPAGEFVSAEGAARGGASGDGADSVLALRAECQDLTREVERLESELADLENRRTEGRQKLRALREELEEQRRVLQNLRLSVGTLEGRLALATRERRQIAERSQALARELADMEKRQEALRARREEIAAREALAAEELESRRAEASRHEAEVAAAAAREADAAELLNELRTTLAVEQRAEQAVQEQRGPLTARMRELEESLERRRSEIDSWHERIAEAEAENARLEEECAAGQALIADLMERGESQTDERTRLAESIQMREGMLAETRREIRQFAEQRGAEEVRLTQLALRMESLETYARERYQVDLRAFERDLSALFEAVENQKNPKRRERMNRNLLKAELSAEGAAKEEKPEEPATAPEDGEQEQAPVSAEPFAEFSAPEEEPEEAVAAEMGEAAAPEPEPAAAPEWEPDWDFIENAVRDMKQRLDAMGPVNLDAIQEYQELEERYNFLQQECDDLNKAKADLLAIIQRINTETKKRFTETFQQVRDNFRASFKELFGAAGQADLVLVNENDPLESGIEVIAKPPGKKPTTITLLSGGERSMTAVALLFSIYMVKPSPFCILDELDAPLDESNIGRFLKMLDKFIEKSQFVIVTHNKRTMHRADVLYGVTMEEFGVSKLVGVKLTADPGAAAKTRDAYVPPPDAPAESAPEGTETPEQAAGAEEGTESASAAPESETAAV